MPIPPGNSPQSSLRSGALACFPRLCELPDSYPGTLVSTLVAEQALLRGLGRDQGLGLARLASGFKTLLLARFADRGPLGLRVSTCTYPATATCYRDPHPGFPLQGYARKPSASVFF